MAARKQAAAGQFHGQALMDSKLSLGWAVLERCETLLNGAACVNDTAPCGIVQCRHGAIWQGTVFQGTVWQGTAWQGTVWKGMV